MFFKGGIIFNLKREKDKQTIKKARFLVFRNSRLKGKKDKKTIKKREFLGIS